MIQGLGCDILRIERLRKWCFSPALLTRVFTSAEIALLPKFFGRVNTQSVSNAVLHRACEQLGGMFSAKEAYKKAVGTKYANIVYMKDIVVEKNTNGAPCLKLGGSAARALAACSAQYSLVSISHEKEYVIATVIIGS